MYRKNACIAVVSRRYILCSAYLYNILFTGGVRLEPSPAAPYQIHIIIILWCIPVDTAVVFPAYTRAKYSLHLVHGIIVIVGII